MAFHSCLYHRRYFRRTWLYVILWVSYRKQKLVTLSEHLGSPRFFGLWWYPRCSSFSVFSVVGFVLFVSPLYALCLILLVPLVCLFFRHDIFLKVVLNTINEPPKPILILCVFWLSKIEIAPILQFPQTCMCHLDDLVTPECLYLSINFASFNYCRLKWFLFYFRIN